MPTLGPDFMFQATGATGEYEILRKNQWQISLNLNGTDLKLAAESVKFPQASVSKIEVPYYNGTIKIAGKPTVSDGEIICYDYVKPDIVGQLQAWFNKVVNLNDWSTGYAASYKKTAQLFEYDPAGNLVRTWNASGIFLLTNPVNSDTNDYSTGDVKKINVQFSCDKIILNSDNTSTSG